MGENQNTMIMSYSIVQVMNGWIVTLEDEKGAQQVFAIEGTDDKTFERLVHSFVLAPEEKQELPPALPEKKKLVEIKFVKPQREEEEKL